MDERICQRTKRILTVKPARLGFTFGDDGSVALSDLLTLPMFKHNDLTIESLSAILSADDTFVVTDDRVKLASA